MKMCCAGTAVKSGEGIDDLNWNNNYMILNWEFMLT